MKIRLPAFDSKFTQVTIITILAIILSKTAIYSLSSALAFKSDLEVKDFKFSDIYNSVSDSPSVRQLSNRVALVSIDGCPRGKIAEVIEAANSCKPAAMGVDVMFEYPGDDDDRLIRAVMDADNLVLAGKAIGYNQEGDSFDHLEESYFSEFLGMESAPVNLESRLLTDVIREFRTDFNCDGISFDAFPVALVSKADKYQADRLKERETRKMKTGKTYHKETIYYPTIDFETVTAEALLSDTEKYRETLKDKVLIIGDVNNVQDMHSTPVRGMLSGAEIHAMAVETILEERYIHEVPGIYNWILAILICVSFIWINLVIKDHLPGTGRLIMRLLQILFLYVCFIVGCKVFAKKMVYFDFSPSLMMMALGFFAYDIWLGALAIFTRIKGIINGRKKCSGSVQ